MTPQWNVCTMSASTLASIRSPALAGRPDKLCWDITFSAMVCPKSHLRWSAECWLFIPAYDKSPVALAQSLAAQSQDSRSYRAARAKGRAGGLACRRELDGDADAV